MWKAPASVLCGFLAALPLIGCAREVATSGQATTVTPAAIAESAPYYAASARLRSRPGGAGCGSGIVARRRQPGA